MARYAEPGIGIDIDTRLVTDPDTGGNTHRQRVIAVGEDGGDLDDIKRALTDFETRLDYGARPDGNPVYVGKATQGAIITEPIWTIQKLEYDASARLVRVQVLSEVSWDGRDALAWS